MTGWYDFSNVKLSKKLSFDSAAEAHGLIYHFPLGENFGLACTPCLIMGEVSLETLLKNIMIQAGGGGGGVECNLMGRCPFLRISTTRSGKKFAF